jgi:hypothetical protein
MKLAVSIAASLFFFKNGVSTKLNTNCVGDNLVITVPAESSSMSNVLKLAAGTCTHQNIPDGIENAVSYDNSTKAINVKIPITACDMKKDLYNQTVLKASNSLFRPTANITFGSTFNNLEMIFMDLHIAAECGMKTIYPVDFVYNIDSGEADSDCTMIGDVCVFPGHEESVKFKFQEYTSEDYDTVVTNKTQAQKPGERIYLELSAENIPEHYDFAVTMCKIIDTNTREHELFNPAEGNCKLDEIELKTNYTSDSFQMSHILFLIDNPKKVSYTMRCQVELCDKDNEDSRCKKAVEACSPVKTCVCSNGTAVTGDSCTRNNANICEKCDSGYELDDYTYDTCVLKPPSHTCLCENGEAATGWNCPSQNATKCGACNSGYKKSWDRCVWDGLSCEVKSEVESDIVIVENGSGDCSANVFTADCAVFRFKGSEDLNVYFYYSLNGSWKSRSGSVWENGYWLSPVWATNWVDYGTYDTLYTHKFVANGKDVAYFCKGPKTEPVKTEASVGGLSKRLASLDDGAVEPLGL